MRTRAIIIKKQNTNEYDQFVICYTQEFGKLTAIAKSILKPTSIQSMHLDNLNLVDFELIEGKAMPIIAGAQSEKSFYKIKNSITSLAVAHFFSEIVEKMVPELEKDEKLWSFMVKLLSDLDNSKPDLQFLRQRQATLLGLLGYFSDTNTPVVVDSNRPGPNFLDDAFEYNAGFRLKSLKFLHSVLK